MAANTHFSIAAWNAGLDAMLNPLNGGYLEIWSGTQPATPDVAPSGGSARAIPRSAP